MENKFKLRDFLYQFISEERKMRFEEISQKRTNHITIALENIFQPHNASAVLRSCDCFGIQNVHVIDQNHTFKPNQDIALGAEKWLNINKYDGENAQSDCYKKLHLQGYCIAATSPHGKSVMVDDLPVDKPIALVFGTEKDGLTQKAIKEADITVALPMYGFTESFNISVSVALFLQSVVRKAIIEKNIKYLTEYERCELLISWCMKSIKNSDMLLEKYKKDGNR